MTGKFRSLKAAMSFDTSDGQPPRWEYVLRDMAEATYSKPTFEAEQLMLAVLRFGGELRLLVDQQSEFPHGLTPEEMIKSLAVQTLAEWRGSTYRPTFRRVAATVTSATLVSVIEAVIEETATRKGRRRQAEPVAEMHSQDSSHEIEVAWGVDGQVTVTQYDRGDRVIRKRFVVVSDFGMSALASPTFVQGRRPA